MTAGNTVYEIDPPPAAKSPRPEGSSATAALLAVVNGARVRVGSVYLATHSVLVTYGSCSSLRLRHLVGVGVPALVGLAGVVLVAASPEGPCVAVGLVAAGPGDDGAAELS